VVGAPVGERAAAVVEPETEVGEAALGDIGGGGGLALPHVPVEAGGDVDGLERAGPQAGGQGAGDGMEFAQAARADQQAGLTEQLVAALLAAGLQHALVGLDRGHQALALIDGEGEGLFAVDILAGLDGGQIDQRVPVVGRGVDHHREILLGVEQLAEIGVLPGVAVLLGGLGGAVGIDIADRHHGAEAGSVAGIALAHAAAADECDLWFFAGPWGLVCRQGGQLPGGEGREGRGFHGGAAIGAGEDEHCLAPSRGRKSGPGSLRHTTIRRRG